MIAIGTHVLTEPTVLAPMAGITDVPYRQLCLKNGAGMCTSEMVTSDTRLWHSRKSKQRLQHTQTPSPRSVQIAGSDPQMMAQAAQQNVALGADIIDINMGCPAKKVCRKAAGSALLQDETLVADILKQVVQAVAVPVTLKIRTGWDTDHRNGVTIAKIAEDSGIQALAVHGRTRACRFKGNAEYDTIARIVEAISIPVFANGDIHTPEKARQVLDQTGAAAVMIGRAAQGNPWIFNTINRFLKTGHKPSAPSMSEISQTIACHIQAIHDFYGVFMGVKIARKHLGWYFDQLGINSSVKSSINRIDDPEQQLDCALNSLQSINRLKAQAA